MYVDSITLAALTDEFNSTITGGRVQNITITSLTSFGLEIYANHERHYLLIDADPKAARCHLVDARFRRGVEQPTTFGLLIRKHLDGARLNAVEQPAWERILYLDFSGPEGDVRLIAELMDQRSNLILTVGGEILDAMNRIRSSGNRARVVAPRTPYVPPPPQTKTMPDQVTAGGFTAILRSAPEASAWRVLVDRVTGVSPLLAREVIYRACEDAEAPAFDLSPELAFKAFSQIISDASKRRWTPCIVPDASGAVRAFAAYSVTYLGEPQAVDSMSAAIAAYYASSPSGDDPYASAKQTVRKQISAAAARIKRKQASLEREVAKSKDIEILRKQGELILTYASTIKPRQVELTAQYDVDGPMLTISLDPSRSAVDNARQYFDRYEKAKRAGADVPKLLAATTTEVVYLNQLATDIELAESWPEIDAVREEIRKEGYWKGPQLQVPQSGNPGVRRLTTPDGFVIWAGRNAEQNHALVTKKSNPDDLWLHARSVSGSHVIIRDDGRPVPEAVIRQAAELAAYYSAARAEASVEVVLTQRRYVRPVKGGRPGQVTIRHEQVLTVTPRKPT